MSEFKGTQGKWSQNGFAVFVGEKEIINDNVICRFHCGLENYQGAESKANALLIAHAPELLEMVEKLISDQPSINLILEAQRLITKATSI